MMATQELKVPDIGDYTDIPVIEILVKVGDVVTKEQSLVTLESDKATMEVPAESAGTIVELRVKLGDKVSMGTVVAVIEAGASASASAVPSAAAPAPVAAPTPAAPAAAAAPAASGGVVDVKVPDIGDFSDIPVIEILVKVGDTVKVEQSLVTLESDKATMEVPSTVAGVVKEIKVKLGDKVSEGAVVVEGVAAAMSAAGSPDTAALATGISEALINTAIGIIGSVVGIIMYNYFSTRVDAITHSMDEAGYSILHTLKLAK